MAIRISKTLVREIDKLVAPIRAERNRGAYALALFHGIPMPPGTATLAQRTVMSWPPIATDLDDWEKQASAGQDALIAASAEDRSGKIPDPEPVIPDPADVSHKYKKR